jgi:hypothetical protein
MNNKNAASNFLEHLMFLAFFNSIFPGKNAAQTKSLLEKLALAYEKTSSSYQPNNELLYKVLAIPDSMVKGLKEHFKFKIEISKFIKDFEELRQSEPNIDSYGIEYKWLVERMDCPSVPCDLPWQAKVGIKDHAFNCSTEERWLLEDAFLILQTARQAKNRFEEYAKVFEDSKRTDLNALDKLNSLNSNIAAYSRLSVVSFYAFLEAFVNSVAYNHFLRFEKSLTAKDIVNLKEGKEYKPNGRGGFLTLEDKFQQFPKLIRNSPDILIHIKDRGQIKEPFETLIDKIKPLRDASAHYSKSKEVIWRKPLEWMEIAELAANTCLGCAQDFWKTCYPKASLPMYLKELQSDYFFKRAQERLD